MLRMQILAWVVRLEHLLAKMEGATNCKRKGRKENSSVLALDMRASVLLKV